VGGRPVRQDLRHRQPFDESEIARIAEAGAEDVDAAVAAARRALDSGPWPKMSAAERGKILWRMGELILERLPHLSLLETLDTGKTLFDSGKIELPMAAQIFQFYAGAASKIAGRTPSSRSDAFLFTLKEPVGVVAAIVPWNFPFLLSSWKVAPALAAGCCVILKPASQTPLTALEMGRIGLDAGLPRGCFRYSREQAPARAWRWCATSESTRSRSRGRRRWDGRSCERRPRR
jgi:acyl-CoA reductase-like NAD-dependent aldehyde dehydrogenase